LISGRLKIAELTLLIVDTENMGRESSGSRGHDKWHFAGRQQLLRPYSPGVDRFEIETYFFPEPSSTAIQSGK